VAPRDLFGGQHERRAAVTERAAVEELERVGDVGGLEDLLDGDQFLELRLGFSAPCRWFFTATAAICASVVPCFCMWARAISAKTPGR